MIDCIEKQHHLQNNTLLYNQQQQQQRAPMETTTNASNLVDPNRQALLPVYGTHQEGTQRRNLVGEMVQFPNSNQVGTNDLIGYYFGSISRETAEWILKNHGNRADGAYLLRSSGPNDDFVLSLMIVNGNNNYNPEVLHYKIVETEDSFVALHGQVGDEKFATIDELIDKAQGVATKPRWPINRQSLDSQILPPTYWGLSVDQIRLAILIKAKQWGFPLLSTLFQTSANQPQIAPNTPTPHSGQQQIQDLSNGKQTTNLDATTTLNNETIRTLIYKSLHEFQPWFHGKIDREEAERRIEEVALRRDGRFLVRERDNYSYAMCISHKKTSKHYRIDVLPTGELAIQDGRKFTSLMALVSHYTIMSDGLWCALTEACVRPVIGNGFNSANSLPALQVNGSQTLPHLNYQVQPKPIITNNNNNNLYCVPPISHNQLFPKQSPNDPSMMMELQRHSSNSSSSLNNQNNKNASLICAHQSGVNSLKGPIKEWIQNINQKWVQLLGAKNQHQSLQSFLFGSQNPLNNHCRHKNRHHSHHHNHHHHNHSHHHQNNNQNNVENRRKCRSSQISCNCHQQSEQLQVQQFCNNQPNSIRAQLPVSLAPPQYFNNTANSSEIPRNMPPNYWNINQPPGNSNCQMPINGNVQPTSRVANQTEQMLSHLPQNAGFSFNTQTIIGSPLFAVPMRQQQAGTMLNPVEIQNSLSAKLAGSNTATNANILSQTSEEEKLISPAHSVSTNSNNLTNIQNANPYHINSNEIYGSQTSTVLVNDRNNNNNNNNNNINNIDRGPHPTTSSSSSSGCNNNNGANGKTPMGHQSTKYRLMKQQQTIAAAQSVAKQIMCGQHAGPAYRYTNCNDENSFKPCLHRPQAPGAGSYRAIDDLQLMMPSTQLVGPAAMTKFVQFQDGQCLRTHRDTQSIQMAYASSRQLQMQMQSPLRQQSGSSNQVPFIKGAQHDRSSWPSNQQQNGAVTGSLEQSLLARNNSLVNNWQENNAKTNQLLTDINQMRDFDLMDCNGNDDKFEFKYDAKLIKSSSIETLCGIGPSENILEEQQLNDRQEDLSQFKTNSELLMSLQKSNWSQLYPNQLPIHYQPDDILNPFVQNYDNCQIQSNCFNSSVPCEQPKVTSNNSVNLLNQFNLLSDTSMSDNNELTIEAPMAQHVETFEQMRKKHDLDEVTTAILAELTASLKAQVDLKNKRSGLGSSSKGNVIEISQTTASKQQEPIINNVMNNGASQILQQQDVISNPNDLINEFDTIPKTSGNRVV